MNTQDQISDLRASTRIGGTNGRRQRRFALRPLAFALAAASMLSVSGIAISPARAQAAGTLPSGLNVVAGQASAVVNGQQMTVTNSANSILNWQSFSIGSNNGVYFAQPDSVSKVLNRVVGNDPSSIFGSLGSNGQVWLLNPNGVLFGQGARVDVGGLVTSTLRLNDIDWLSGRYQFAAAGANPAAGIVNQGELRSSLGGRIALLGGSVRNEGLIDSPDGQVVLAAGRSIDLIDTGTPNLRLRVTAPDGEAMNLGTLAAAGGRIDVHAAMVNQQGIVRADGLGTNAAGEIVLQASGQLDLRAGSVTSASGATGGKVTFDSGNGTAMLEGDVLATGTAGSGGRIKALGSQIGIVGAARMDVSGRSGGEVFVGGGERGEDASIPNSRAVFIGQDTSMAADALGQGDGGRIVLWSNEATRAYGSFSARGGAAGGNGGFIETSGGWIDIRPARLDASAAVGLAGTWLLDPLDIFISDSVEGDTNTTDGPNFTATGSPSGIQTGLINSALNSGNSVVISTGTTGTEPGDILVQNAGINVTPTVPVSLTLQAARNIEIRSSQIVSNGAGLSVNLNAAGSGVGSVYVDSVPIVTAGGSISANGVGRASASFLDGIGVYITGSNLNAGSGNINLVGSNNDLADTFSARSGITIANATLTARDLSLTGSHAASNLLGASGINISDSTLTATHGMSLRGTASSVGIRAQQSTLAVTPAAADPTASLFIDGTSTWSNLSASEFTNYGVVLAGGSSGSTLRATNGATMDITGRHMGGALPSLRMANGLVVDAATGGDAKFTANSPLEISANMVVGGRLLFEGDDVTILAGSTIQSAATGDAIVIAGKSGPNTVTFVNNAGAGALSTPNGRWLIYGQNTASLNPGGLNYTFKQYSARYLEANPLTPTTGNGLLYAEAPVVTVQADPFSKVYDGATASGPLTNISFTGQRDGDLGAAPAGTSGNFSDSNAGLNKAITIAPTAVTFTDAAGRSVLGYGLATNILGDILRRNVSLTGVTAANKVYDGNTLATVTAELNNLVGSETLGTALTGNFDTKDAGLNKLVTVSATLSDGTNGGLASNYVLSPAGTSTTADIARRQLTGSFTAANKVYDGNTVATVTIGSLSGLVGSETLGTTATGNFGTKDAGTGKTVTVGTTLSNGTNGGLASNYTLAPTDTTSADITRRQLTGSFTATNKVYDGNTVASVTLAGLDNLVGAETLNVTTTGNFNTKDVGNAKPVSVNVAVANGANGGLASNYIAPSATPTPNASITPATLTYTANPANKLVDGPLPPLTGSVSGFVASETQATATTGTTTFVTPATAASPAGLFAINGSGLAAGNYDFRQDPSNASALFVTGLSVTDTDSSTQAALNQSLASVSPQPVWSSPAEGRVFDAMQALRGNYLGQGTLFRAIPVDEMSQDALTTLLVARDEYKKALFASAIRQLEQDPSLADLQPCKSAQEVDNGSCLITEDLKRELKSQRVAMQVAATPAPASTPAPSPAPALAPSTDTAIVIPPALPREGVGGSVVAEPTPIFASRRVRTASLPQITRKIAVVIGINRYADRRIPQLENAVGDAQAIGKVLEDQLGYETVILENASKASVVRTLNRLAIELDAQDSVVIYYAGHGELIESTGLGYWQLSDSNPTRPETWLSNADISRTIAKINADQVAVISDSCYSGSLVDERIRASAGTVDLQQLLAKKSVVVMSSGGNEPVFDEGKNGHSPFAYSLMRNLEQVNNWQIGSNLFERVRFAVARQLPQRPLYGAAAAAGHQPGGDYLFEQRQLDK